MRASQTRAVLSRDAVTTRWPSGLNSAYVTRSPCRNGSVKHWPVTASQIRAVSAEAVTKRVPSGLKRAESTPESCLSGLVNDAPVRASQICAFTAAVATRCPSGLKRAFMT